MVSYIFLDSEQLLTYAFPPKNAKKYPKKIFLGHPTDFRGLIRPLNIFFNQIKALQLPQVWNRNLHRVSLQVIGEIFFGEMQKTKAVGTFCPPPIPSHLRVKYFGGNMEKLEFIQKMAKFCIYHITNSKGKPKIYVIESDLKNDTYDIIHLLFCL